MKFEDACLLFFFPNGDNIEIMVIEDRERVNSNENQKF